MAIIVPARVGEVINIGRAGENKATIVTFDVTDWLEEFEDNGQFTLIVQQGGEDVYVQGIISPGTGTGQLPGTVQWEITSSNTAIVGAGKCELIYEINQIIVKSIIYDILVTNALDIELQTEAPEPIITWLNNLDERIVAINEAYQYANNAAQSANEAAASVNKVENLTVEAITGSVGEDASVSKTTVGSGSDAHYHLSFTLPKGDTGNKGDKGDRGSLFWDTTVAPSTPNYTFTISNLTGNIGESPQIGDIIFYSYYKYAITSITSTTAFSSTRVSLRGATGATGNTGATGEQGPVGPGATIAVGTVTTGNAGSSATVTNSGTSTNAVLNFIIPKGDKGDTGNAAGFGTPTAVIDNTIGSVGIPGVSVSASGSNTAKVFNFKFGNLKGDKGDTGEAAGFGTPTASINNTVGTPSVTVTASGQNTAKVFNFAFNNLKGDKGNTGEISIGTTTTGNAGTSAIVTNSGTSTDAILNFTIPKGDKGDTGEITVGTVATGNAGSSVVVTNSGTSTDAVLNFTIPRGDRGEQGVGFAGTLTSLPTANSTNYNAYKDKVWVCNGHAYSIIESNGSYSWIDGGIAAGITANLYDWTT